MIAPILLTAQIFNACSHATTHAHGLARCSAYRSYLLIDAQRWFLEDLLQSTSPILQNKTLVSQILLSSNMSKIE